MSETCASEHMPRDPPEIPPPQTVSSVSLPGPARGAVGSLMPACITSYDINLGQFWHGIYHRISTRSSLSSRSITFALIHRGWTLSSGQSPDHQDPDWTCTPYLEMGCGGGGGTVRGSIGGGGGKVGGSCPRAGIIPVTARLPKGSATLSLVTELRK